ncbi:hypothetical protein BH23CHL5_BH23CHL5_19750 [soil metagenome]
MASSQNGVRRLVQSTDEVAELATSWLAEMQSCVRAVDFERCRAIFAADVVAFGSKAGVVSGLDALEGDQWRHVWPTIHDFTFLIDQIRCGSGGGNQIWMACPWTSERTNEHGRHVERAGRMTAVLERRGETWLAVHTHHSLVPAA